MDGDTTTSSAIDLQDLVARAGGYDKITPGQWHEFSVAAERAIQSHQLTVMREILAYWQKIEFKDLKRGRKEGEGNDFAVVRSIVQCARGLGIPNSELAHVLAFIGQKPKAVHNSSDRAL